MKKLIISSLLLLTGCSTMTPDQKAMWQATANFNYVADIADEWRIYDRIDQPFYGDCGLFQEVSRGGNWQGSGLTVPPWASATQVLAV